MIARISTFTISFVVAHAICMAQPLPGNSQFAGTGLNLSDHLMILDSKKAFKDNENIEGTPYLKDEFALATVFTKRGHSTPVSMRYNLFENRIEFQQNDVTYLLSPADDITKITFDDYSVVVAKSTVKGKITPGYYILLDSGKVTLLERKIIVYKEAQAPKALESDGKPARFEKPREEFLYKIGNGLVVELSSVKKFIESLPDHQEEVGKFAGKEKISKKEKELIELVRYYNSL